MSEVPQCTLMAEPYTRAVGREVAITAHTNPKLLSTLIAELS